MKKIKNKNYGFTLIELLATIVILGLLALIVTPGVAKVIKNSKINTSESSMEGYVREVENAIALYMTDNGVYPTSINQLELDGKNIDKIENANVTFGYGEISKVTAEINGLYCIYEEKMGAICDEDNFNVNVNLSTLSIGDAVYYNPVADIYCSAKENGNNNIYYVENNSMSGTTEGCLKWNVLSKNADGSVNLLLDHNILSGVKWASKEDYVTSGGDGEAYDASTYTQDDTTYIIGLNDKGPVTAVSKLEEATKEWHESLTRNDVYDDYDNTTLKFTVDYSGIKARLPEAGEIVIASENTTFNQNTSISSMWFYFDGKTKTRQVGYDKEVKTSSYAWLFNNLGGTSTDSSSDSSCLYYGCTMAKGKSFVDGGYWTSTSLASNTSNAWRVFWDGRLISHGVAFEHYGIRPVITLNN